MNEKPILFKGEMVRAILDGRKTQTRRLLKKQPIDALPMNDPDMWVTLETRDPNHGRVIKCRYGIPGDRLWVRETWRIVGWDEDGDWCIEYKDGSSRWFDSVQDVDEDTSIRYWEQCTEDCVKAGIPEDDAGYFTFGPETPCPTRWRPSIHMPRWASRITLEIVNVRVERLQEIDNHESWKEGIPAFEDWHWPESVELHNTERVAKGYGAEARDMFAHLWNSINEKRGYGWNANPWLWVIEFKRIDQKENADGKQ